MARFKAGELMKTRALSRATAATLTNSFAPVQEHTSSTLPYDATRQGPLQLQTSDEMYRIGTRVVTAMKPGERVIACTGVSSGDPSAKFALHLGVALARLGSEPVIVIDGNLRTPSIHKELGTVGSPGLSELLQDSGAEPATIRISDIPNLLILTAGKSDSINPAALTSRGFEASLHSFRECAYVVIDVGPLLVSPESMLLVSAADAVVATITAGERSKRELLRLKQEAMRLNSRFLGVVIAETI
jgi:Mrp family chromosome partitioning ATPase